VTPENLADAVLSAARAVFESRGLDPEALPKTASVERPRNPEHGDYATNLALQVAKKVGANPRELASALAEELSKVTGVASVEVAGPGFLNVRVEAASAGELARSVVDAGAGYGHTSLHAGQRFNLEFVSSNPTGPIHLGGERWAAEGDALAR
jgi:arginyl-tRNA synthetase